MADNSYIEFLLELLEPLGDVRARAMFGGYGIYQSDLMFGLVADDELYLKVDAENIHRFEEAGLPPFLYEKNGKQMKMSYNLAPAEALDNEEVMLEWAKLGIDAAKRNKKPKKKKQT